MSRLHPVSPSNATGKEKELLDVVKSKLGIVPNMTRVMAASPVVLEAYLGFSGALASGLLDAKTREELALMTAQENHCNYCLSAHTAIGKMVGLNHDEIVASRVGNGTSPKTTARYQGRDQRSGPRDCAQRRLLRRRDCRNHRTRCAECVHQLFQRRYRCGYRLPKGFLYRNRLADS
jgi:AhpD family alkylhydroperoxidase